MTQPPLPPPSDPPPPSTPPAPKRARSWIPWLIAGVAVIAMAAMAVVLLRDRLPGAGLSQEVAQRECRTALEREAARRATELDPGGSTDIVVTMKRVDLQETYETEPGFAVNAAAVYTLTSGFLPQVEQSVSLTCAASGTDDAVKTTVANRG